VKWETTTTNIHEMSHIRSVLDMYSVSRFFKTIIQVFIFCSVIQGGSNGGGAGGNGVTDGLSKSSRKLGTDIDFLQRSQV
jgi:hypothetical protein